MTDRVDHGVSAVRDDEKAQRNLIGREEARRGRTESTEQRAAAQFDEGDDEECDSGDERLSVAQDTDEDRDAREESE